VTPALRKALAMSPVPLDACLENVDLGDNAPEVGPVYSYRRDDHSAGTGIQIDLRLKFDAALKLLLKVGPLKIGIDRVRFDGMACLILRPLLKTSPVVGGIQLFFMNPPEISLSLSGSAGHVADFTGVAPRVKRLIESAFNSVLVLPQRLAWKLSDGHSESDGMMRNPIPHGVLRLWVLGAHDLIGADASLLGKSTSDPYCLITLGSCTKRTATKSKTCNPVWEDDDFGDFLVFNYRQQLQLDVFDEDVLKADDFLGSLPKRYTVARLMQLQASANAIWSIEQELREARETSA